MPVTVRRAIESQLQNRCIASGEFVYCTDSKKLYLGNDTSTPHEVTYRQINEKIICSNLIISFDHEHEISEILPVVNTTDNVLEGTYNKYFSKERVKDILEEVFRPEQNNHVTLDYKHSTNQLNVVVHETLLEDLKKTITDLEMSISEYQNKTTDSEYQNKTTEKYLNLLKEKLNHVAYQNLLNKKFEGTVYGDLLTSKIGIKDKKIFTTTDEHSIHIEAITNFRSKIPNENVNIQGVVSSPDQVPGGEPSTVLSLLSQRGNLDSPMSLKANDTAGIVEFKGYNGSNFRHMVSFVVEVVEDPKQSATFIDSILYIFVGNSELPEASLDKAVSIDKDAVLSAPIFKTGSYLDSNDRDTKIPNPQPGMIVYLYDNGHGRPTFQGYTKLSTKMSGEWQDLC